MLKKLGTVFVILMMTTFAQQAFSQTEPIFRIVPHAELGFVSVLNHVYRVGTEANGNTTFDFVKQGAQDVLFPYARFSVDAIVASQHRFTVLYQPLTIKTQTVAGRNGTGAVQIDDVLFAPGTPLNLTYGFDFFRLSYLYDFIAEEASQLGIGLSFQLRNANIDFSSADGLQRVVQNNVGLVPIIKIKAAHRFAPEFGIDFEADGFYASSAVFNGAGRPFEGWIWDAALRLESQLIEGATAFLSIRTIGGGASGNNAYDNVTATTSSGAETYNSLATLAVTLGVSLTP